MSSSNLGSVTEGETKRTRCCFSMEKSGDYCSEVPLCTDCVLLRSKTGCASSTCAACTISTRVCSLSALTHRYSSPPKCPPPCISTKYVPSEKCSPPRTYSRCNPSDICPPRCPSMPICDSRVPPHQSKEPNKYSSSCLPDCPPSPTCRPMRRSSCCCSPKYLPQSPLCTTSCPPENKRPHPFCPPPPNYCEPQPVCPPPTNPCEPRPLCRPGSIFPPRCPVCCEATGFPNLSPARCKPCQPCPCPSPCSPPCPPPCSPAYPAPCCFQPCAPQCLPKGLPTCPDPCQTGYQLSCSPNGALNISINQCSPRLACPPQPCISPCCPPPCPPTCPPCNPPTCPSCCPPCTPSPIHCCSKEVEDNRPRGYSESVSGQATWDTYGLRFKWTDPSAPGMCRVCCDQAITVKMCLEVHPSSHLTPDTLNTFCWTHMKTMCNPCGVWRELPLQFLQDASSVDECGVCRYIYCTSLTPLEDEACKLTFNVRWGKILVWANNNGDECC